ncbi:MAG: hypothetical protein R3B47_18510 [Bacteroidia bacterium]
MRRPLFRHRSRRKPGTCLAEGPKRGLACASTAPGTGKSQVIVLIANALAHDKRVLLVSQKRAALGSWCTSDWRALG